MKSSSCPAPFRSSPMPPAPSFPWMSSSTGKRNWPAWKKEREKCQSDIDFIGRKLDNPGFVAKAPAQLIETERAKLAQHKERMAKILESIAAMRK